MDINKYALFADVAESKNFTKSGEHMGYTQPGVSHILKAMEQELGFPLFLRNKQGVSLTSNAEIILPIIRRLLSVNEELNQTISSLNGLEIGHLTIASFASISRNWLPALIYSFRKEYPGIEVELLEGGTDDIVKWIEQDIADFGFLSKRHTNTLDWISLAEDPLMAILPQNCPFAEGTSFPISALTDQSFIISAAGTDYDVHYALETEKICPKLAYSSKDDYAIVSMVANNLGYSILPKLAIKGVSEQIRALPLKPYYSRELGIAMRSQSSLSPAAKHFVESVHTILPSLKAEQES